MAYYYIKSGLGTRNTDTTFTSPESATAFGSGNLTAANVYPNFGACSSYISDGDVIFVSDAHNSSYNNGTNVAIGPSSTYGAGVQVISVSDSDCTVYSPGASEALNDNFDSIRPRGNGSIHGVTFKTGNDTIWQSNFGTFNLYDCTIITGATNDKLAIISTDGAQFICHGCTFTSDQTADHLIGFEIASGARVALYNCAYTVTGGSEPVRLVAPTNGSGGAQFYAEGCDFSACTTNLMDSAVAGVGDNINVTLKRCKLDANITLPTPGTNLTTEQHVVELYGCTNSTDDALHQFFYANGCGVAKNNDSVYTSSFGGWFGGSNKSSIKVETTSLVSSSRPFRFSLLEQFIDLTSASSDVVTLNMVTDATLTDTDIAAFLTYSDGTNVETPRLVCAATKVSGANWPDPLASGTTLATSSLGASDWTGEPASPNFYKIDLDTSSVAGTKCVVKVAIEIYKDITTATNVLYIDPTLALS